MIKVIELFAGIGSQHSALKRLGIGFEVIGIAEIDKYAIKSYEAIHGKVRNYGDISKIERLDPADFWTYSFPCQDLSVAGKQKGLAEGTRSGLLYEVERLLDVAKENNELPKYLMLENVKNLVGKKFKSDFDRWIGKLNQLGYNTYWKVLNAKHYGVPQNRERVFAISIRKDVDMGYQFPDGFDNGLRLKDILEDEVDEKFYINTNKFKFLKNSNDSECKQVGNLYGTEVEPNPQGGRVYSTEGLISTIGSAHGMYQKNIIEPTIMNVGNVNPSGNGMNGKIYHQEGLSPTLTTNKGEGHKILIPQATTKGYIECSVPGVFDMTYPDSKTRRGRVQDHGEIVPTLTAASQDIMYVEPEYRIRKLTPKECFRLMGFTDEEFYKAEKVNSNSQLYKQAGNSIVVDVLCYLFRNLFLEADGEEYYQQLQMEVKE